MEVMEVGFETLAFPVRIHFHKLWNVVEPCGSSVYVILLAFFRLALSRRAVRHRPAARYDDTSKSMGTLYVDQFYNCLYMERLSNSAKELRHG
jgi:hypothetical protein